MMGNGDPNYSEDDGKGYALSGKIMLSAIVILFFVVILMVCLHLYARWFIVRARRRHLRRRHLRRRTQLVFYVDPASSAVASSRGLDSSLLLSLPVFVYSSKTHPEPVECPVCLSEFEEGETGRVLPKCNHSFHIDCIDMWFKTHSTCPVCRAPVEPAPVDDNRREVVISVCEPVTPEPGSTSGLCVECQHEGEAENRSGQTVSSPSSSIGFMRKPSSLVGVTVEVPRRNESFADESSCESPSTQSSFRSPMSRMRSFKRMLSRDRKGNLSPSSGSAVGCSSPAIELEKEQGGRDETQ